AEVLRRAQGPANQREQRAVGADEREVGLRVATVHGQDCCARHSRLPAWNCGRCCAPASSSRSTSSVETVSCATRGCVSSALCTSERSPVTAAWAARRSYAVTCCIN